MTAHHEVQKGDLVEMFWREGGHPTVFIVEQVVTYPSRDDKDYTVIKGRRNGIEVVLSVATDPPKGPEQYSWRVL